MNVPIFLARQLGKHQVGMSWNEVSRRYVSVEPEFFSPAQWRAKPKGSIKQGSCDLNIPEADGYYKELIKTALFTYNSMLEMGVAPELARMVLPQSMMTQVIWTGSVMAFAHVYNLRIDAHSQVEAQDFARELGFAIKPLFPTAWASLTVKAVP